MAWRVINLEKQREDFITNYLTNDLSITDLCREFSISRKTGYKWISRYELEGLEGLKCLSKTPHNQINKTPNEIVKLILSIKNDFQKWGAKKILGYLKINYSQENWPSRTTIDKILSDHGLIVPRKYRKRFPAKIAPLSHCNDNNDVWCIDFKGWAKTKDNIKCDPITLTDAHSRYLLYCRKLHVNTAESVWDVLSESFHKYGLPLYLRHDNGPPFATSGAGRLSHLSVNLIKAGVTPEWIQPGKPYQNGRHERMHLTLKQEGVFPSLTLEEQQMKFIDFQKYYNFTRPHEALKQNTPGSLYTPSPRTWNGKLKSPEYLEKYKTKKVREGGQIALHGNDVFIGKTLKNEYVGLKENEEGHLSVYFGPVFLGVINDQNQLVQPKLTRTTTKYKTRIF